MTQDRDGQLRALNYITDATKVEISESGTVSINPDRRIVDSNFVSSFNRDVEAINQRERTSPVDTIDLTGDSDSSSSASGSNSRPLLSSSTTEQLFADSGSDSDSDSDFGYV